MHTISHSKTTESLSGFIERVTYHQESTGFCVLRLKVKARRELVTLIGNLANVRAGESIQAEGEWINDKVHGLQFKANHCQVIAPTTVEGMQKYLASGLIKGIGVYFAKTLIQAFGDRVFEVIESEPSKLGALPGIGAKRQESIVEAWRDQKAVRDIMTFLHSHGVGTSRAVRIYKTYGQSAVHQVTENPYRLAVDIMGIGFKTADQLAKSLGVPSDSLLRAKAGLHHALQEAVTQGHCALHQDRLIEAATSLLEISPEILEQALREEIEAKNLILENIEDIPSVYLKKFHHAEVGVALQLHRLMQGSFPWGSTDLDEALNSVSETTHRVLSESQQRAVRQALTEKVMIITGGPGVGKTTVVHSILTILKDKQVRIQLCAPTGRAAQRLFETTGIPAQTIHRLLSYSPANGGFQYNQANPLELDYLVIDETSMVDLVLMHNLLKAIPSQAAILLIGDVDQLPSVGPGSVLADLIDSQKIACVRLTEIFRQAATSHIITNAHRINQGDLPLQPEDPKVLSDFYFIESNTPETIQSTILKLIVDRIPKRFGFDPIRDLQILTPMNIGSLGTHSLNIELQKALNGDSKTSVSRYGTTYSVGDKVIQTINNYDKDVFNGDIGRIEAIDLETQNLKLRYGERLIAYDISELDEIALAYVITIHKSQGSEYPVVIIPLSMQHYRLLERNLIYTAVTRGKKLVIIVGQKKALEMAISQKRLTRRVTNLVAKL